MGKVIYSTDDNALEALKERLAKQEADHEEMKKRNEYFRKNGTMVGYPDMPEEKAKKIDERIAGGYGRKQSIIFRSRSWKDVRNRKSQSL